MLARRLRMMWLMVLDLPVPMPPSISMWRLSVPSWMGQAMGLPARSWPISANFAPVGSTGTLGTIRLP